MSKISNVSENLLAYGEKIERKNNSNGRVVQPSDDSACQAYALRS